MRRIWVGVAIVLVAGLGAAWAASDWALGTCGAIDRWTGSSGCIARHQIADIRPLAFVTMVPVDDTHVRLFGMAHRDTARIPTQLVVDIETGAESGRQDLPLTRPSNFAVIPSQFGQKVAVICIFNHICSAAKPQGFVLSVADGTVLEPLEQADALQWYFPGERPRTTFAGAWLSDTVSAEPDIADGSIILLNGDRRRIGRLSPERPDGNGAGPGAMAVRLSGSGRYLALIDSSRTDGSRIDIYDVETKTLINTITTDDNRRVDSNAVWMPDEQHLVLLQDWSSIRKDQRGAGTELYVFKVR